jgi:hypothetical protein
MRCRTKNDRTVQANNGDNRERTKASQRGKIKASRKQEMAPCNTFVAPRSNRSESRQSSSAFEVENPSLDGILRLCRQWKEVIRILRLRPFRFHPFCFVSFRFPPLSLFAVSLISHFPVASSFPLRSKTISTKSIKTMPHSRDISQPSGKASTAMNCTSTGKRTDIRFVNENAHDSIRRNNESESIEIDESDLQPEKQEEPRISMVRGMQTKASCPKYRMRTERSKLCKK